MKEKLGCGLLILVAIGAWIGLIKGCHVYDDWRRNEYFKAHDEKVKTHTITRWSKSRFRSRERRICSECKEYDEVNWCGICSKYYCEDCYVNDIAITHEGNVSAY